LAPFCATGREDRFVSHERPGWQENVTRWSKKTKNEWSGLEFAITFLNPFIMSTTTATMSTEAIANRLIEICNTGDFEAAQKALFSKDAVSIEPHSTPAFQKETKGLDAILEKGKKWSEMVEKTHDIKISGPLVGTNSFALTMFMDVTMKGHGRSPMTELCVYNVKDGKIVSEQFFM
jgi:limonene-1,2-epoxide hydrolase